MSRRPAERIAEKFAALGHPARVDVLRQLLAAHPDGLVAGEIQDELDLPASTLSHHLDALKSQGLVEVTREGRNLRYRAASPALQELLDFLYAECCTRLPGMQLDVVQIGKRGR